MPCASHSVAIRTTHVQHPRASAPIGAVLDQASHLWRRYVAWRDARRLAFEAERWLESATARDLADIGLAPRVPGIRGAPTPWQAD
jgi:uncharacterized protein YjiS (DUF1127 family)